MRSRPNVVLLVIGVLVVVLAVVAALLATNRTAPPPDLTTPEGVTQAYVLAALDGDQEQMATFLDPELECEAPFPFYVAPESASVSLVSTRMTGSSATVVMEISESTGGGGPFPMNRYSRRETFSLVRLDDRWLITGNPWPVYECRTR